MRGDTRGGVHGRRPARCCYRLSGALETAGQRGLLRVLEIASMQWRDPVLRSPCCESWWVVVGNARQAAGRIARCEGSPEGEPMRRAIRPARRAPTPGGSCRVRGPFGGERSRGAHPERRVRAAGVVVLVPVADHDTSLGQACELLDV